MAHQINPNFYYSPDFLLGSWEPKTPAPPVRPNIDEEGSVLRTRERLLPPSLPYEYEVGPRCGQGTYGTVYSAVYDQEPAAIKFFSKASNPESKTYKKAVKELQMLEKSSGCHNVLQLRGWGIHHTYDQFFILFDLHSPLPCTLDLASDLPKICKVTRGIFNGIAELHRRGIIHGDIKPLNCLMNAAGEGIVADLGSATYKNEARRWPLQTVWYRDPRDFIQAPYDQTVDLWGAGCTLWELAMGLPLFPGEQNCVTPGDEDYYRELHTLHIIVQLLGMPTREFLISGTKSQRYLDVYGARLKELPTFYYKPETRLPQSHLTNLKKYCQDWNSEQTTNNFVALIGRLVTYGEKISAEDALKSPFFLCTKTYI